MNFKKFDFKTNLFGTLAICALATLSACDDGEEVQGFAPACPKIDITPLASEQTNWQKGADAELAHMQDEIYLATLNGTCAYKTRYKDSEPFMTRVAIAPEFVVKGGPAQNDVARDLKSGVKNIEIAYYVAIMNDGKIVDKKIFSASALLPPEGQSHLTRTPVRYIDLPTGDNPQENNYHLIIGLQLSQEQLNYNRLHRAPVTFTKEGVH